MQIIKGPGTMVKKITILLIGLFAMLNISTAQVSVIISDKTANTGQTVDIDVTLNNFNDIILFQYSINYDPSVLTYNSIVNVTTALEQFSAAANIGTPANGGTEGQLSVSWSKTNTQPESLPANTRLFTIRFNVVGSACSQSTVRLSNSPTVIEFVDSNVNNVGAVADNGSVMVNGTNCNGGGGMLTISAGTVEGNAGTNICIPITVSNFINIQSVSFGLNYNPAIVSFTGIKNAALPGFNDGNVFDNNGLINLVWFDNTGVTPVTLQGTLVELCFDITGTSNQTTPLTFVDPDFSNADEETVPFIANNGAITVSGSSGGSTDFTLEAGSGSITTGETSCIPVLVRNFSNIQSMQFAIMWDATVLTFAGTSNYNLTQLTEANFNPTSNNKLRVTWNNLTGGTSVPNNRVIFEVCFSAIGDCDDTSAIMFTNDPPISIEVSNGNNEIVPVNLVSGSVSVDCGCNIGVEAVNNPTCNGATNGSILVNVGGSNSNLTCTWRNSANVIIQQTAECNLLNVGAGTYTLTISDGAECNESREFTLTQPANIVFGGSKTNEVDGCDGIIVLQMVGGVGPFTFKWDDNATTQNRNNLCAGEYCVTATDSNGCEKSTCFTVLPAGVSVTNAAITNVRCFGDSNGGIDISVFGGTAPYTFSWQGPGGTTFSTEDISGVPAGNYALTITDASSPALTFSMTYQITQPNEVIVGSNIAPSDGDNGSIVLNISGGVPPYSFAWSPGGQTTQNLSNLAPGEYSVIITDDNNCNINRTFKVNSTFITIDVNTATSVSCFGTCDASINGNIAGGSGNFTYILDGSEVNFPITGLCPGDYILIVEDDQGVTETVNITVNEPEELLVEVLDVADCADETEGFITIAVTGGTGSYSYQWSTPGSNSPSRSGLSAGTYAVLVTDGNDCTVSEEAIVIETCTPPVPCYTAIPIITPNGDDKNNEFFIACATNQDNTLKVYNRWGQLVFSMINYDNSWYGLDNSGNELPEGAYMWILEVSNANGTNEIRKGTITILRDQF